MKIVWTIILILISLNVYLAIDNLYAPRNKTTRNANNEKNMVSSQSLPQTQEKPFTEIMAETTGYTLSVGETDSDPSIGACGTMIGHAHKLVACPRRLSCGTFIEIDGQIYKCWDRLAEKYRNGNYFDILFGDKKTAFNWGRRIKKIKIYK